MNKRKLVIFNGSPRKEGTSYSFASTIKKLAEEKGCTAEILHIIEYFDGKKDFESIRNVISGNDILGLSTALYVDTLPCPVIWFFEKVFCEFKEELKGKDFFAVSQSAFPDITRSEPLLGTCRCFAEDVGMNWLGGLAYGGGVLIDGRPLEDLGRKGRKITSAFRLAVQDIIEGRKISSKAQDLLTVRIPVILNYPLAFLMNLRMMMLAKKNGAKDIGRKVYLDRL